jgi:hypothetical protein
VLIIMTVQHKKNGHPIQFFPKKTSQNIPKISFYSFYCLLKIPQNSPITSKLSIRQFSNSSKNIPILFSLFPKKYFLHSLFSP